MAAFTGLDWARFDVTALVNGRGIGVIDPTRADQCRNWLLRQGYAVEQWHFDSGIGPAVTHLGKRLRWEEQFGCPLDPQSRNLDALRDGFLSDEWHSEALVLEVHQAEVAWRENPRWFMGVLAIAQEHSLCQLALGQRFFVLLVLEQTSPLIDQTIESSKVPGVYWRPGPKGSEFQGDKTAR
jgi:hypothetical protein